MRTRTHVVITLVFAAAQAAFAQGTIRFDNNIPGVVVTRVYDYKPGSLPQSGNGPADYPPGTTDWTGWTPISGPVVVAQLWGAPTSPGIVLAPSSLAPASPIITFGEGSQAGFLLGTVGALAGVPADAPVATLQLRVWDTEGGHYTWPQAQADGMLSGWSEPFNVNNIGGIVNPAPALQGLTSFSLIGAIPEPSTPCLLALGAAALWLWRRRG